jgi:hypothetical protein
LRQQEKHKSPIEVIESGRKISVNSEHREKHSFPIEVIEFGREI